MRNQFLVLSLQINRNKSVQLGKESENNVWA